MAFIKTEVDTDKDKKVTGKGVDYISKELEQMNSKFTKQLDILLEHLGLAIDTKGNVDTIGLLGSFAGDIENLKEKTTVPIAKKYEVEFVNTYNWNEGLIWSKNHGLNDFPDMVEVFARFGNYYMKLAHQLTHSANSTNDHYLTSIVVNNISVRFESSDNLEETYFHINGVQKDPTDIDGYKIVAIKF